MHYPKLIASFALCFFVAFAGSLVTMPALSVWYESLNKPSFNPPNWIFGPVWSLLYILMSVSLYLVWKRVGKDQRNKNALFVFFIQLFLNFLWSFVFFGLQEISGAAAVILLLWLSIFATIMLFKKIDRTAAYLLVPYLAWVTFASVLNLFIVGLN